jgi:hypothetical protein
MNGVDRFPLSPQLRPLSGCQAGAAAGTEAIAASTYTRRRATLMARVAALSANSGDDDRRPLRVGERTVLGLLSHDAFAPIPAVQIIRGAGTFERAFPKTC